MRACAPGRGDIIVGDLTPRRTAVFFLITAILTFMVFDLDAGAVTHHVAAALPCLGTLALLPSDPGAWITKDESPSRRSNSFVPAIPPRAPPA
jgi:hypothetical protein